VTRPIRPLGGHEDMPWLEPVEQEVPQRGPSSLKVVLLVLLGLLLIGGAVGFFGWLSDRGSERSDGVVLIRAPEGDYKILPDDPGGMAVEGEGDMAFAASEGAEPQSRIDLGAVPEAPLVKGGGSTTIPAGAEGTIQLGAFSSQASAQNAWKALSARFAYLEPLTQSIVPVEAEERTLYRLRASGPGASALCRRLTVAGETCLIVS
jgi:hypothetical protein